MSRHGAARSEAGRGRTWLRSGCARLAPQHSGHLYVGPILATAEIERLMAAARKSSRYGHRDATMILIGYRHGLRASELCDLQWSQVELATGRLHVRRAKNGSPSVHPMQGDEIRALRRLQREQGLSSHVFVLPKAFHYNLRDCTGRNPDALGVKINVKPRKKAHPEQAIDAVAVAAGLDDDGSDVLRIFFQDVLLQ